MFHTGIAKRARSGLQAPFQVGLQGLLTAGEGVQAVVLDLVFPLQALDVALQGIHALQHVDQGAAVQQALQACEPLFQTGA
jgi:hypothetical protein